MEVNYLQKMAPTSVSAAVYASNEEKKKKPISGLVDISWNEKLTADNKFSACTLVKSALY